MNYIRKLLYILQEDARNCVFILFAYILVAVLESLGIGLVGPFISVAANPGLLEKSSLLSNFYRQLQMTPAQFIALIGAVVIGAFLLKSILYFFSHLSILRFSFGLQRKLELRLFSAYLIAPYTFYLSRNSSSFIKNISWEAQRFSHGLLLPMLAGFTNLITLTVITILLAYTNHMLLVMTLGGILPVLLMFLVFRKKIKYWGEEGSNALQEMIRVVNHGLGSLKETRVFGSEVYFLEQMGVETQRLHVSQLPFHLSQGMPRILLEIFLVIPLVAFVILSQFIEGENANLVATLSIFAVASIRLMPAATEFLRAVSGVQGNIYLLNTLYYDLHGLEQQEGAQRLLKVSSPDDIFSHLTAITQPPIPPLSLQRAIRLQHVTYRYPDTSEPVLKDICLTIQKGQSIALIGKSGAGKTTLVDVILGLLEPSQGAISVDDVVIERHNLPAWYQLVGYIPQTIFLMDDTIERNIAFGVPDHLIDHQRLDRAIAQAQLQDLIADLPQGVQTVVGERGVRLSGGQRQRIGIARVLYHEREVLILDEATSALDNDTEAAISQAIQQLSGKKTLIIIAHRLSTIEHCDIVYILDKGEIVKSGSYREVVGATS
jgi:ABC-type multidrug transport system fused ATPase/permease subunit